MGKTLLDKVWESHVAQRVAGQPDLLYVDLHLVHEVTSPQAFESLRLTGRKVRRPDLTLATMDHNVATGDDTPIDPLSEQQLAALARNCEEFGVPLYATGSGREGIVHVIGPELGLTQPGKTIVCGDSHTATHGAFGALAFGIGTSQVGQVLATQCLLQQPSKTYAIRVEGKLQPGVTAKDIILAVIARIGIGGGTECVFEYTGSTIRGLSMEERMTICNMSIEGGARAGLVAPDDTTYQYIAGREFAPKGKEWDAALARWKQLPTDEGATYAKELTLDANTLEPMVTFGTNPGMGIPVSGLIPDPASMSDPIEKSDLIKALKYMDLKPGVPLKGQAINVVFVGSCTNSRISDLRAAASIMKDRKVSPKVRMLVVPGSQQVKKQAEAEGLDKIFREAGADFREAGCSMCIAINGDQLEPGEYSVSTSNRNFEGRQGKGGRTFLASPLTAAASAITGVVTDVRSL